VEKAPFFDKKKKLHIAEEIAIFQGCFRRIRPVCFRISEGLFEFTGI